MRKARSRRDRPAGDTEPGADERILAHLLTASPVVIYRLRPSGDFGAVSVSRTVERLMGYRPDEFLADPRFGEKQVHPDDAARHRAALREAARCGSAVLECRMRVQSGEHRWFRHEIQLIRDDAGRPAEIVGTMVDVTRENRAEERLRQTAERPPVGRSEQRFKDYADAASDWFWEMDAALRYTHVSERLADAVGVEAAGLLGRTRDEIAAEDVDAPKWQAHRDDLRQRRSFRDFEYRYRRGDGATLRFRVSGKPVFAPGGEFLGYRGIGVDVTAQRQAEEALHETQARAARAEQVLAEAIESLSEGFVLLDAERRFVLCNSRYREFYPAIADLLRPGVPFDRLMRQCVLRGEITLDDDVDAVLADRFDPRRRAYVAEERLSSGRWLRVSDHRTKDGGIVGIRTDITALKRQEHELRRREQQLSEAQKIARMGHWRWEAATGRLEWSDGTHRLMATSPDAYRPDLNDVLARIRRDDRRAVVEEFKECLATGQPKEWQYRIRNFAGAELTLWADAHCEFDGAGRVAAIFGVCQDITERKSFEASLNAAKEQAVAASRAKSAFLASMSHELRTPLNAIIGFGELMASQAIGPLGNQRYAEYARDILNSGRHLLSLIDDLLDVSRIESGKLALRQEALDPRPLIDEAVQWAETAEPGRYHRYEIRLPRHTPRLHADRRAVRQILVNLLSNAAKFTPDGGLISVSVAADGEAVTIVVADTGIGIPAERIPELGQPFAQVDPVLTRRRGGSGLGLFITRSLVEHHGGRLTIESQPGQGTRVAVRLPRA